MPVTSETILETNAHATGVQREPYPTTYYCSYYWPLACGTPGESRVARTQAAWLLYLHLHQQGPQPAGAQAPALLKHPRVTLRQPRDLSRTGHPHQPLPALLPTGLHHGQAPLTSGPPGEGHTEPER